MNYNYTHRPENYFCSLDTYTVILIDNSFIRIVFKEIKNSFVENSHFMVFFIYLLLHTEKN